MNEDLAMSTENEEEIKHENVAEDFVLLEDTNIPAFVPALLQDC